MKKVIIFDRMFGIGVLLGLVYFAASLMLSGCVKHIETSGGTKIDFLTGADFHVGLNGIDTVKDERSVKPKQ